MREIEKAIASALPAAPFISKTPPAPGPGLGPGQSSDRPLFDKYEIGEVLGCGSFAKVYKARNIENNQTVAIKVINKKLHGTISMSNIKREMTILQRLRHPNIVRLHEALATQTKVYFIMELAKGGDLYKNIPKGGRFREKLSRKCFQQLISAVDYCHLHSIYHRDLKSENILVDEKGDLKVSDFGLSATIEQVKDDGQLHTICGTPAYVAPEILSKKGYDGAKTDIWSCGVILFEMSAGFLPFNGDNIMEVYRRIYAGRYRCPEWMSPDLRRLLSRLLDTNPMTRITIDEIKRDPWFKKGYKEKNNYFSSDFKDEVMNINRNQMIDGPMTLNAFDLISFSPGLDLSGFFDASCGPMDNSVRLAVEQSPKEVLKKVVKAAKEVEDARLKRYKVWGVELHGHRAGGSFIIVFEIFRLTDKMVVLEAKRRAGAAGFFHELWEKKIMPSVLS